MEEAFSKSAFEGVQINDQEQSLLFRLPIELRDEIYRLALTAERPFTDPRLGPVIRSPFTSKPPIPVGIALLRTCRRIYHELDISVLYLHNSLRFTSPRLISAFLHRLPSKHRQLFRGITCDLRTLNISDSTIGGAEPLAEWTHYLYCTRDTHPRLLACRRFDEVLRLDVPRPLLRWVGFDITVLQKQLQRLSSCTSLRSTSRLWRTDLKAKVLQMTKNLRMLCQSFLESQRRDDARAGVAEIRIMGIGENGEDCDVCLCPGDDGNDGLLRSFDDLFDGERGYLKRSVSSSTCSM